MRLISATNKDLATRVKEGAFREDLYYRLNVVPIVMPPLRARMGDVPLLARVFVKEFAKINGKSVSGLTMEALELMMAYSWPGNVRELRAAMEHAVVFSRGESVAIRDLPAAVRSGVSALAVPAAVPAISSEMTVRDAEKELIAQALKDTGGNRTLAAQRLGVSRRTLHRKLHKYHLEGF